MAKENIYTNKKKVVKVATYSVVLKKYDDGTSSVKRQCDGFNPFELLGFLESTQLDIKQQMAGNITPDIIVRRVKK